MIAALRHGSLVVVQPLLTLSLLFTIALASLWTRQTMRASEWAAVIAVVRWFGGVPGGRPPQRAQLGHGGARRLDRHRGLYRRRCSLSWLVGLRGSSRHRAAALGLAAGLGDALMAVLTKAFAHASEHGLARSSDVLDHLCAVPGRIDRCC